MQQRVLSKKQKDGVGRVSSAALEKTQDVDVY